MVPQTHRLVLIGLAFAGCVLPAACTVTVESGQARVREEREFEVTAIPDVELDTFEGPIEVRAWDRPQVRVDVEKFGGSREAAEAVAVEASQDGNRIRVQVKRPAGVRWDIGTVSSGARMVASVPRASNVTATSGDGGLSIERVNGVIRLSTGDGTIRGFELDGDVTVETGDGTVKLDHLAGTLRVRSEDGSVWVGGRLMQVDVVTGDGAISLKLEPGSRVERDWELTTGDGAVVIHLPDDLRAGLDAATEDGKVRVDKGLPIETVLRTSRSVRARLGNDGGTIRVRTGNGSISFRKF